MSLASDTVRAWRIETPNERAHRLAAERGAQRRAAKLRRALETALADETLREEVREELVRLRVRVRELARLSADEFRRQILAAARTGFARARDIAISREALSEEAREVLSVEPDDPFEARAARSHALRFWKPQRARRVGVPVRSMRDFDSAQLERRGRMIAEGREVVVQGAEPPALVAVLAPPPVVVALPDARPAFRFRLSGIDITSRPRRAPDA